MATVWCKFDIPLLLRHTNHLNSQPHTIQITFTLEVAVNRVFHFYFFSFYFNWFICSFLSFSNFNFIYVFFFLILLFFIFFRLLLMGVWCVGLAQLDARHQSPPQMSRLTIGYTCSFLKEHWKGSEKEGWQRAQTKRWLTPTLDRLLFVSMTNLLLISSLVSLMSMSLEGVRLFWLAFKSHLQIAKSTCIIGHGSCTGRVSFPVRSTPVAPTDSISNSH